MWSQENPIFLTTSSTIRGSTTSSNSFAFTCFCSFATNHNHKNPLYIPLDFSCQHLPPSFPPSLSLSLDFLFLFISMANNYSFFCLIGAIDSLWFHQTILFSEPISLFSPKGSTIEDQTPQDSIVTDSFTYPSSTISFLPHADEEFDFSPLLYEDNSSDSPQMTTPQVLNKELNTVFVLVYILTIF